MFFLSRFITNNDPNRDIVCASKSSNLVNNAQSGEARSNKAVDSKSEEKTCTTRVLRKRVSSEVPKNVSSTQASNKKKKNSADPDHEDCIGVGKSAEGTSGKTLKTLYTLDNGNWSDATDEISETTQPDMHERANSVVVDHANKSIGDLIEAVKTIYCSPRRLPSLEPKVIFVYFLILLVVNKYKLSPTSQSFQQKCNNLN